VTTPSAREEAAEAYWKETFGEYTVGALSCEQDFKEGWGAAVEHVLSLLRSEEVSGVYNDTGWMWADWLEGKCK
jgi:hypothetical protein